MEPIISVEGLTFSYGESARAALEDLHFQVWPGEFIGVTGPAGAGKSTLVLCINGIIPHFQTGQYHGKVVIAGKDTFETSCAEISKRVGSVFQDPEAQIVAPMVEDEVAFGLENFGVAPKVMETRITEALQLIDIAHLRHRSTTELSGGQKQRVAIAAAVALRPEILILDEPTSELDPIGTIEVFEVLRHLNRDYGLTVIVVEQKINLLLEYIQRLLILDQGRLQADCAPAEIIREPERLSRIGLRVPPVSELAYLLQKNGLYRGELPLTVEQAYQGLAQSLGEKAADHD